MKAIDYLNKHDVTDTLNTAVNKLVVAQPEDPFAFLSSTLGNVNKTAGKPILYYLPVRARAENVRMMFFYAGVAYDDVILPFEEFGAMKSKGEFPFDQLPVLEVDGVKIAQSGAVSRYVAKLTGLYPSDPVKAALSDAIFEAAQELAPINPVANVFAGEQYQTQYNKWFEGLPRYLKNFSKLLGSKPFMVGDTVTFGDFMLYHILELATTLEPKVLCGYPHLSSWMERMIELPGMKECLDSRLPLREQPAVKTAPLTVAREYTFIMVKPDGVQRGLVGDIVKRFEAKGFHLVTMKLTSPSKELLENHYADLSKKKFFPGLIKYMLSGPVCCMVWEGLSAVKTGRVMLGATNPADSAPGTLRGDSSVDIGRNIIHGSDSVSAANKEISMWFHPSELTSWQGHSHDWVYE